MYQLPTICLLPYSQCLPSLPQWYRKLLRTSFHVVLGEQVTDAIIFQFTRYEAAHVDLFEVSPWEGTLFGICMILNISALTLSWVHLFDILQQEREALAAQEEVGTLEEAAASGMHMMSFPLVQLLFDVR
jgi:hypothetical protein